MWFRSCFPIWRCYIIGMEDAMLGRTFGQWTVVSFAFVKKPHKYYNCRCSCGTERPVQGPSLKAGTSASCGCTKGQKISKARTTHGSCSHPAYQSWTAMRRRCQDSTFTGYRNYGARGITVCDKWQTFEGFWADMGASWALGLTIERNDVNGNYAPENCRWATYEEQASNRRVNVILDTPWGKITQAEAARRAGISLGSLIHRMKSGWPKELWLMPSTRD